MCHYRPEHYLISAAVNAEVQLKYLDPESGTLIFRSELEYCGDHCSDHCGGNFRVGGQLPLQYLLLYKLRLPVALPRGGVFTFSKMTCYLNDRNIKLGTLLKEGLLHSPSFNKVPILISLLFAYHVILKKVNTPPVAKP